MPSSSTVAALSKMKPLEHSFRNNDVYPPSTGHPPSAWVINVAFHVAVLPALEDVRVLFMELFSRYRRFQSIASADGTWTPAASVDGTHHIVQETMNSDDAMHALECLIAQELPADRPLWRVHLLPTRSSTSSSPLIVLRVHHCLSDGVRLTRILSAVLASVCANKVEEPGTSDPVEKMLAAQAARDAAGGMMGKLWRRVIGTPSAVICFLRTLIGSAPDDATPYSRVDRAVFGQPRRILRLPSHSLDYMRAIKDTASVSLNAALLSVLTGALRRYSASVDPAFEATLVAEGGRLLSRATMPVPLPLDPSEESDGLGNGFAVVSCRLAMGEASPLARLAATRDMLEELRTSPIAAVTTWTEERLLSALPASQRQAEVLRYVAMHSLDFSSVPGPSDVGWIAGAKVDAITVSLPQLLPQLIILSYNGMIYPTLTFDPAALAAPDALCECYAKELVELGAALGMRGDPLSATSTREACLPPPKYLESRLALHHEGHGRGEKDLARLLRRQQPRTSSPLAISSVLAYGLEQLEALGDMHVCGGDRKNNK